MKGFFSCINKNKLQNQFLQAGAIKRCAALHFPNLIDYKDFYIDYKHKFMKIYRKRMSVNHTFLTINTLLPANNYLRLRKNLLDLL